jgi:hypothetical protein
MRFMIVRIGHTSEPVAIYTVKPKVLHRDSGGNPHSFVELGVANQFETATRSSGSLAEKGPSQDGPACGSTDRNTRRLSESPSVNLW